MVKDGSWSPSLIGVIERGRREKSRPKELSPTSYSLTYNTRAKQGRGDIGDRREMIDDRIVDLQEDALRIFTRSRARRVTLVLVSY